MSKTRRYELHDKLKDILGSENVYFQPPESIKLKYPCIVYYRNAGSTLRANNTVYGYDQQYSVTFIGKDPDSDYITPMLAKFPMCYYDRRFESGNLYHDVFQLYY